MNARKRLEPLVKANMVSRAAETLMVSASRTSGGRTKTVHSALPGAWDEAIVTSTPSVVAASSVAPEQARASLHCCASSSCSSLWAPVRMLSAAPVSMSQTLRGSQSHGQDASSD